MAIPVNDEYITTDQLATLTHSRPQTWRKRRLTGDGPPFIKLGSRVLYRREDVNRWLAERVRQSTSDPGPAGNGGQS